MALLTGILVVDLVGVLVSLFAVILAYLQWNARYWKRKNIPYIGPSFPLGGMSNMVFSTVKEAKEKGWDNFGMFFLAKPFFVSLDLDIVKCFLTKDFNHFTDRGIYYNEKDDPLAANLFVVGNPNWRRLRTKLTPTFTSAKMREMFQTVVDCGTLLEQALKEHPSKEPVDIKYALVCYSMDIIGSCAFGLECNSFKEPNSPFIKFGRKVFQRTVYRTVVSFLSMSFPKLALALHARSVPADVSNFYYDVVSKTLNYREKNSYARKDFLQLLVDIKNGENKADSDQGDDTSLTMDELVAQCFVFFLAGFETSASTVTFALFELSRNAEIQEKVREELLKVLKKYDNKISYDALKELEYMQQVIDETLRKYPALPFLMRRCILDYNIPNTDIVLEKGTGVLIPIKNIHYDENIYENPEKFDPDRFTAEQKQNRPQYAHLPFGEGPRNCIGMRFGLMQSKVALTTILSKFRVKLNSKTKLPLEMDPKSLIPTTIGGIWLDFEEI